MTTSGGGGHCLACHTESCTRELYNAVTCVKSFFPPLPDEPTSHTRESCKLAGFVVLLDFGS